MLADNPGIADESIAEDSVGRGVVDGRGESTLPLVANNDERSGGGCEDLMKFEDVSTK